MQVKLAGAALVLSGCFHAHGHYRHHRSDAWDAINAIATTAVIVDDLVHMAHSEPAEEPLPPPLAPAAQAAIDRRREMLDHIAGEVRQLARDGQCSAAARNAHFLARIDRDYFEAYVSSDPDVGRCIVVAPDGTRRWSQGM